MKTWQVVTLIVIVGLIVWYFSTQGKAQTLPAVPPATPPIEPGPAPTTNVAERMVQNTSYSYSVREDANGTCHYFRTTFINGAASVTAEITELAFVNAMGGWMNICNNSRFRAIECINNACMRIRGATLTSMTPPSVRSQDFAPTY